MSAIRIAMFNHKGGVSKTTSTLHIAWMLAEQGHQVLMVDADPQCNLTGLLLGSEDYDHFEKFYQDHPEQNIKAGLKPAYEAEPKEISAVTPYPIKARAGLHLLPGHIDLSEYEVTLSIAQELSGALHPLKNIPGAAAYLIDRTADALQADYALIDLNPSLSALNRNLLLTSDYFIVPNAPDYFSLMALKSLCHVLPGWQAWLKKAQEHPGLKEATYPLPSTTPKFLGTLIQNFRLRKGTATEAYRVWIDRIDRVIREEFVPALSSANMACSSEKYQKVGSDFPATYRLGLIPDFNTLQAKSQVSGTPVFDLTEKQLMYAGIVLEQYKEKQKMFHKEYSTIATRILALAGNS